MKLGSHDMMIAEVLNVRADEQYIYPESGAFDLAAAHLVAYSHGKYFTLGELIGSFGFSVKKKKD
jgi:flavin reductase (DIM6/NTAB) family NADH-FMN oxidoreductase RutF